MEKIFKDQNGLTLVEVLMAKAIFLIGILAFLMMQIKAIDTNSSARSVTENYTWAMDKIEELLALEYTMMTLAAAIILSKPAHLPRAVMVSITMPTVRSTKPVRAARLTSVGLCRMIIL